MNRAELESLLKSFLLFFISLELLFSIVMWLQYKQNVQHLDDTLYNQLKICSFTLKCKDVKINFVHKNKRLLFSISKQNGTIASYFAISRSSKYMMKLILRKKRYQQQLSSLTRNILIRYILISIIILIFSIFFSLYALNPMRRALILTEEFIKDILHDFNTPLSVIRLNTDMLKTKLGDNKKINRIEQSIQTILSLQSNLKTYLKHQKNQSQHLNLRKIIAQQIQRLDKLYPLITFNNQVADVQVFYNQDALNRIIENLLTNAAKYNKPNGKVTLKLTGNVLIIEDTGIGIKNPKKIFQRFYKENERGIGIGLHIVKKLCDELNIKISVKSVPDVGTTFYLKLSMC